VASADRIQEVKESQELSMFNIDGYSRVIPVWEFRKHISTPENKEYWSFEFAHNVVEIIDTGELFTPRVDKGKYRLFPLNPPYYLRDRGFEYDEPMPNLIGKATQKKVEAWVEYHHLRETARRDYANMALCDNLTFAHKFKVKYPDAEMRIDKADGWVESFRFRIGGLSYHYEAMNNGRFSRRVEIIYSMLPTNDELLK
jgi:hypothetical protein